MSALGRYILSSALFLSATLCLVFARTAAGRNDIDPILGLVALFLFGGAFRALGYAMRAENENLDKD